MSVTNEAVLTAPGAPRTAAGATPTISVSHLTKKYRIGHSGHRPTTATEAMVQRIKHPFRRAQHDWFAAVDDVSFDVPQGEILGIVGRNGAGKSTLLKLLTRITAPTAGRVELMGRVGSLLEVGTGFHPELTGRENIFLNGALMGMRRTEIKARFDEIVAFAGVEAFLDTPVKRYSSGMYVRLAFSVAAHLDTEILAIDEVLAVGDAEFQARSVARMREAARDGRTVLFVSHQMATVSALCTSAIFLDSGRLAYHGPVEGALERYRSSYETFSAAQLDVERRSGSGELRATAVRVAEGAVDPAADKVIEIDVGANTEMLGTYYVSCHINDANGSIIAQCDSRAVGVWLDPQREQSVTLTVRDLWLKPGMYTVDAYVCKAGVLDSWEGAAAFDVLPTYPYPDVADEGGLTKGMVLVNFDYEAETR